MIDPRCSSRGRQGFRCQPESCLCNHRGTTGCCCAHWEKDLVFS